MNRAAKKAAALAVGVVVSTAQAYRSVRDWFGGRKDQPFRPGVGPWN